MATKRIPVTEDHEQAETLAVNVIVPGHDARGAATPLFHCTRLALIAREGGRCWISGMTAEQSGHPLEAHHYPIERCFAEAVDWPRFSKDCVAGKWGTHAQQFDWAGFFKGSQLITRPDTGKAFVKVIDPYLFVDDMTVNGRVLAKQFHVGKDEGVHMLPEPIFLAQKYLAEGYKLSEFEIVHHEQES